MIYELLRASMRAELKAIERDVTHRMAWAALPSKSTPGRARNENSQRGELHRRVELRHKAKVD